MKSIASRWSAKSLQIAVYPDRVVLALIARGWGTHVLDKRIIEVARTESGTNWQPALAALDAALTDFSPKPESATVILSNHFVRYAVMPWRDNVIEEKEREAFAGFCLKTIYGEMAKNWDIRISDDGFRRNALVSAIDRELPAELSKIFLERKIVLKSVQPYFMTAYNRFAPDLARVKSGCFCVLEPGRAVIAIIDPAGWQGLTVRRIAEPLNSAALAQVLAQELPTAEIPENSFIAALEAPGMEFLGESSAFKPLQLKEQRGFSPQEDARYAMALCGVV